MKEDLPADIAENAPLVRRTTKIALLCALFAIALWLASSAFAQTIYLPSVGRPCGNPCAHSIPMPTITPTAQTNEPPVP